MRLVIIESSSPKMINGKRCSKCRGVKPLSRFSKDKTRKDGHHPQCSSCVSAYQKQWSIKPEVVERNRAKQLEFSRTPGRKAQIREYQRAQLPSGLTRARRFKLRHQYGLEEPDYFAILNRQNGGCAICKKPFASHSHAQVDHCHGTGLIRGLLCCHCNRALGQVSDRIDVLSAMIDYLQSGGAR